MQPFSFQKVRNDLRTCFKNIDVMMLVTVPDTKRPPFPVLNTTAQSEKISFWNVQSDNFLKKIVESLVGMCNQNDLLIWEIVEKQVHHLRCRVVKTCFLDLRPSTSQVQQAVSTRSLASLPACTAVSVFPVPGGPTTIVRPGFTPERIASTCTGVKRIAFSRGLRREGRCAF